MCAVFIKQNQIKTYGSFVKLSGFTNSVLFGRLPGVGDTIAALCVVYAPCPCFACVPDNTDCLLNAGFGGIRGCACVCVRVTVFEREFETELTKRGNSLADAVTLSACV